MINENLKSVPIYLQVMEKELTALSKRKMDNLSLHDTKLLREKVRELLIKNELLTFTQPEEPRETEEGFTDAEKQWFEQTKIRQSQVINGR